MVKICADIYVVASVAVFWVMHLYQSIWKFASFVELRRIALGCVILGVFHALFITLLFQRMPISYYLIGISIQFVLHTALSYWNVASEQDYIRKQWQVV